MAAGMMDICFSLSTSLRPADIARAVQRDAGVVECVHALLLDLERLALLSEDKKGEKLVRVQCERNHRVIIAAHLYPKLPLPTMTVSRSLRPCKNAARMRKERGHAQAIMGAVFARHECMRS